MSTTYVPGVCNIGETEIAQRKRIGWIGLGVSVVYLFICYYLSLAPAWRIVVLIPASLSATGFLQAFTGFCAGYGLQGVFNFSSQLRKTDTVAQAEFRAKDKAKALQIFAYSLLIGATIALIAYFA